MNCATIIIIAAIATSIAKSQHMREIWFYVMSYDPDPKEYARLAGFGYRMLAEAIKADLPYRISCPALLICGAKDKAGSAKRYNKKWHQREGLPLKWIKNAGHNSNADQPGEVNRLIEEFISEADRRRGVSE